MIRLAGRVRVLRDSPVSKSCSLVALASTILSTMSRGQLDIRIKAFFLVSQRSIKKLFAFAPGGSYSFHELERVTTLLSSGGDQELLELVETK